MHNHYYLAFSVQISSNELSFWEIWKTSALYIVCIVWLKT